MKVLLQRVSSASVSSGGEELGSIDSGFMALVGCRTGDVPEDADRLASKLVALRVFEDEHGKMNRSLCDIGGSVLAISQFTLYADTAKGHRPSFVSAGNPEEARRLYERFLADLRSLLGPGKVQCGRFGADMSVSLVNEGPVTLELKSEVAAEPSKSPRPVLPAPQLEWIRADSSELARRIRAVAEASWPLTYGNILPAGQIPYMIDWMYSEETIKEQDAAGTPFFLVRADGVDSALVSFDLNPDVEGACELHKLYSLPHWWGRGLGHLLLEEVARRCSEAGAKSVWLRVNKENQRAQKAYRAAGFRKERAVTTDIGGGFAMDDFVYRRTLR